MTCSGVAGYSDVRNGLRRPSSLCNVSKPATCASKTARNYSSARSASLLSWKPHVLDDREAIAMKELHSDGVCRAVIRPPGIRWINAGVVVIETRSAAGEVIHGNVRQTAPHYSCGAAAIHGGAAGDPAVYPWILPASDPVLHG